MTEVRQSSILKRESGGPLVRKGKRLGTGPCKGGVPKGPRSIEPRRNKKSDTSKTGGFAQGRGRRANAEQESMVCSTNAAVEKVYMKRCIQQENHHPIQKKKVRIEWAAPETHG